MGNSAKFEPVLFITLGRPAPPKITYVRPVGGPENTSNIGAITSASIGRL